MNETLLRALKEGNILLAREIFESGADINQEFNEGNTPLLTAIHYHQIPMLLLILERKPNLIHRNTRGHHALSLAVSLDQFPIVVLLLHYGFPVDYEMGEPGRLEQLYQTKTPIFIVLRRIEETFRQADNSATQYVNFCTPVSYRLEELFPDEKLEDMSVREFNARRASDGCTSLHLAIRHNKETFALHLLSHGAAVDLKNHDEHCALDYIKYPDTNPIIMLGLINRYVKILINKIQTAKANHPSKIQHRNEAKTEKNASVEIAFQTEIAEYKTELKTVINKAITCTKLISSDYKDLISEIGLTILDPNLGLSSEAYYLLSHNIDDPIANRHMYKLIDANQVNIDSEEFLQLMPRDEFDTHFEQDPRTRRFKMLMQHLLKSNVDNHILVYKSCMEYLFGSMSSKHAFQDNMYDNLDTWMMMLEKLKETILQTKKLEDKKLSLKATLFPKEISSAAQAKRVINVKPIEYKAIRLPAIKLKLGFRLLAFFSRNTHRREVTLTSESKRQSVPVTQSTAIAAPLETPAVLFAELIKAGLKGDLPRIDLLISRGAPFHHPPTSKFSIFEHAGSWGRPKVLEHLIRKFNYPYAYDDFIKVVYQASFNNNVKMIDWLIGYTNSGFPDKEAILLQVLELALENGSVRTVEHLITRYKYSSLRDIGFSNGENALYIVSLHNQHAMLDYLMREHKFETVKHDPSHIPIFLYAISHSRINFLKHMMYHYTVCNFRDQDLSGNHPLGYTLLSNDFSKTAFLLEQGAYVDLLNNEGYTCGRRTVGTRRARNLINTVIMLFDEFEDMDFDDLSRRILDLKQCLNARRSKDGCTILHLAVTFENAPLVKKLLQIKPALTYLNDKGESVLQSAKSSMTTTGIYINALVLIAYLKYLCKLDKITRSNKPLPIECRLERMNASEGKEEKQEQKTPQFTPMEINGQAATPPEIKRQIGITFDTIMELIPQLLAKYSDEIKFEFAKLIAKPLCASFQPVVAYNLLNEISDDKLVRPANAHMHILLMGGHVKVVSECIRSSIGRSTSEVAKIDSFLSREETQPCALQLKYIIKHLLASNIPDKLEMAERFMAEYVYGNGNGLSSGKFLQTDASSLLVSLVVKMHHLLQSMDQMHQEVATLEHFSRLYVARTQPCLRLYAPARNFTFDKIESKKMQP